MAPPRLADMTEEHRNTSADEALRLVSVRKVYGTAENSVTALAGVTLSLPAGSFTAIMGPSGSGKTTLLQCASGLDRPTEGSVFIDGVEMTGDDETALTKFRRERIGFVFQRFNLMPTLTVLENVTLPQRLAGRPVDRKRAIDILERVGLENRLDHRPAQLSGGQQQRVAVARTLASEPSVIFADEPTGALDSHSATEVLDLLQEAMQVYGRTVVMVTHNPVAAACTGTVLFLADGRLVGRLEKPSAEAVAERLTHLTDEVTARRARENADGNSRQNEKG
jgi:putative ABC transport system ATP-binding protein